MRWPNMLSLMSSSTPTLTGTRSRVNCVIVLRIAVLEDLEVVAVRPGDECPSRRGP